MALAERLAGDGLDGLSAGIVAAAALDIARDSRSFANRLGVAHALVLRACVTLAEDGILTLGQRDERTQRLFYDLTLQGERLALAPFPVQYRGPERRQP
ncbi:hypothetical protein [Paenirhodobacter sp.]|uniref:hypothetical protein n=1 Tax=Paenirhodobacter sp. TaxID=1965326 RepID=UPI003B42268A